MSPHSGLSRIKGFGTGGRGPPAKDVSAHSGLAHELIAVPYLVRRSGNPTPLLLASQAWQSSPPNLLRSSGSRPLTAFAFGSRRVLAYQTFCEIWAQGPVSLLRLRVFPLDSATHEWHSHYEMEQIPLRKLIRRSVIFSNAVPIRGVLDTFSTTCTGIVFPIQSTTQ